MLQREKPKLPIIGISGVTADYTSSPISTPMFLPPSLLWTEIQHLPENPTKKKTNRVIQPGAAINLPLLVATQQPGVGKCTNVQLCFILYSSRILFSAYPQSFSECSLNSTLRLFWGLVDSQIRVTLRRGSLLIKMKDWKIWWHCL